MTHDDVLYGKLKLWQPDTGPRVNMDTVLLAAYVRVRARTARFIELGSAAGAVSLMLALRFPRRFHVTGLEIQPELAALAERNLAESGLAEQVDFRCMDLRDFRELPPESFDGLAVNPPYETALRGRVSPRETLSIARHETCCTLTDILSAARWLLKAGARFFAVFNAARGPELLSVMSSAGVEPKRVRFVHPTAGKRANLMLVEGVRGGGGGLVVEPPLVVYDEDGRYTKDLLMAYELEGLPCL